MESITVTNGPAVSFDTFVESVGRAYIPADANLSAAYTNTITYPDTDDPGDAVTDTESDDEPDPPAAPEPDPVPEAGER
jgi:hypothetical protein